MNPQTHQLQQTVYVAAYNSMPDQPDDLFRILARVRPDEVQDADSAPACKLEPLAATPSYEP
jgi:branched-chain amino acid transport system substrate-binding protein